MNSTGRVSDTPIQQRRETQRLSTGFKENLDTLQSLISRLEIISDRIFLPASPPVVNSGTQKLNTASPKEPTFVETIDQHLTDFTCLIGKLERIVADLDAF